MTTWKYTDATQLIVSRTSQDGRCESALVTSTEVQKWLSEGNTPLPADPPTSEELAAEARRQAIATAKAEAKADTVVQYLREHTVAECVQYVEDNVTNLATAKAFLKKVAVVLCVLIKDL